MGHENYEDHEDHTFFNGWALWQKMTFVLAGLIVLTILAGLLKLAWMNHKNKHYVAVATQKQEEASQTQQARGKQPKEDEEKAVPFGIRAIESGIEVEGVWISRTNTPAPSSRASSFSETCSDKSHSHNRTVSGTALSRLEMPQPVRPSSSRPGPSVSKDLTFLEPAAAGQRSASSSRASSPTHPTTLAPPARQHRRPPSSYARYSNYGPLRNSFTLDALEGVTDPAADPRKVSDESSASVRRSGSSRTSSSGSDCEKAPAFHFIKESPTGDISDPAFDSSHLRPSDRSLSLDLMQSHRLSHVAETGQLTPRVRRPARGSGATPALSPSDGSGYAANSSEIHDGKPETTDHLLPQRNTSSSSDGSAKSTLENLASTPPSSPSSYTHSQTPHYEPLYLPHKNDSLDTALPVQTAQNQRTSQVLRKVNSGFEILRPGTLGPNPADLDLDIDLGAGEKRTSRKLQKKRRTSSEHKSLISAERL